MFVLKDNEEERLLQYTGETFGVPVLNEEQKLGFESIKKHFEKKDSTRWNYRKW